MALVNADDAQATTMTLGSDLANSTFKSATLGTVSTFAQTSLPGRTTVSPITGTIVDWKVVKASGGPFMLQVVHPLGGGFFNGGGTTAPAPITGTGVLSFTAHLRIQAGDLIGVIPAADTDRIGISSSEPPGTAYDYFNPPLTDGGIGFTATNSGTHELGIQATVATDCRVPNLKGLKLGRAQTALTSAGCTTGTVTKPFGRKSRKKAKFVVGQNPSAGQTVEGLTPVNLFLGKKPKKKKR
jgi:hypothetical protein